MKEADFESDTDKRERLAAFRERAKHMTPGSGLHRVYDVFDSLEEFSKQAIHAAAGLRRYLDETRSQEPQQPPTAKDPIPKPPALYAEPHYIGSHQFVGRQAQLDVLNDWAVAADPHPVLLFDAIGGTGKSMLTWEWTTNHAARIRTDWTGRFWYSFYERGAIMADFCRRALAYMTSEPLDSFRKIKTRELGERLLHHLQDRPWLLVLDGLERVLVAYHRIDAAQLADDEADRPIDQIAHRDPCHSIRHEDDDLLRALASAAPSKLLITSRLVPRVLLNPAGLSIPGVLRVSLPGLRPADAESLLRSCGISGNSQDIQSYLKSHCDCHPLVTGILGGLIQDYLPAKGNFDAWVTDSVEGGGRLNLANLDLRQKRNHVLNAGIAALSETSRQLLSTLALLSEAVDYSTLSALNPRLSASKELARTVRDLERRGLLQYDNNTRRYDLHPVVRGVAAGRLAPEESNLYGQRVVDHFSERSHNPYDQAETLDDLRDGLVVVRTLLKMGRYQRACSLFRGELSYAVLFNLNAYSEILQLLRPFFQNGWVHVQSEIDEDGAAYLAATAALALLEIGEQAEALAAAGSALGIYLKQQEWPFASILLRTISSTLTDQNHLARCHRSLLSSLKLATMAGDDESLFMSRLFRFVELASMGEPEKANAMWQLLDPMGRNWSRAVYRPGMAEYYYARARFWEGTLTEANLADAEQLARSGKNRTDMKHIEYLRAQSYVDRGEWALACDSFGQALGMARAAGLPDIPGETWLALAKLHLGQLADPCREAEQLSNARKPNHRGLAELWLAIGDREQAKKHALAAYKWAWADGEPYVRRYELTKATGLLERLGVEIPKLPPYDPAKDEKFPLEDEVAAAIEKLRAEKESDTGHSQ